MLDTKMFAEKVTLVTGGTSGIGRATAVAFGKEGAQVIIAARRENLGNEVVKEIEDGGGQATFIRTDVRMPEEIDHLFKTLLKRYGRLDIAFNNAGASLPHVPTAAKTTLAEWDLVLETNLRGVWLCMRQEIPQMLKQGGGIIVNTSSILGFTGEYGLTHYCASKHGILALTKTAALEYARENIRINAVCPGPIMTAMIENAVPFMPTMLDLLKNGTAMKRIGSADEVAGAVLWLCSDEASFMIGKEIVTDGGYTV
ncbi:MAG: glucose 1-dehydrogenase [Candidatus Binatia bacterium]|jgi:NAD(P)-dependent dehydrogenase (short-subunit alcohol dehydrogenase family)